MNQKRKAELQRKLSIAPVAHPPAGLAERIKNEIPDLRLKEKERVSGTLALTMRVAASVILVVTSLVIALQFLSSAEDESRTMLKESAPAPRSSQAAAPPDLAAPEAAPVSTQASAPPQPRAVAPVETSSVRREAEMQVAQNAAPAGVSDSAIDHTRIAEEPAESAVEGGVEAAGEGRVLGGSSARAAVGAVTAVAAAPAPAALPPPPANSRLEQSAVALDAVVVTAQKGAGRERILGVSVDDAAFARIKDAMERGEKPEVASVDVEALVNYFASSTTASRGISIETEASPPPVPASPRTVLLRISVDTPSNVRGSSVASNVQLSVEINPRAVASFRRVGSNAALKATEADLREDASVTFLIELTLKPAQLANRTIATATLHYDDANGRRARSLRRTVTAGEVKQTWSDASRRQKLATLSAVWGESLRGEAADGDLAARAERLADESPSDERARELAAAANASSRLRSSAPTGSGQ